MGFLSADGRCCRSNGSPKLSVRGWAFAPSDAKPQYMTNKLALWLGALIAAFFLLDVFVLGWDTHIVIMRKLIALIDYIAFWR